MKLLDKSKLYIANDDVCKCAEPVPDRVYLRYTICRKCGLFVVVGKKK